MVWQTSKPADTDKIKDSASDLRDNFSAIEVGDVPFDAIQVTRQASAPTPTQEANSGLIYGLEVTQDDGSTTSTELHYKDEDGNVSQLTSGGAFLFPKAMAKIDATTGNIVSGTAYNIKDGGTDTYRVGTGQYKVTFNVAMPRADYIIIPMCYNNSGSSSTEASTISVASATGGLAPTTTTFHVNIRGANGAGTVNADWSFAVFSLD